MCVCFVMFTMCWFVVGLRSDVTASSFGKVTMDKSKDIHSYRPEDIAASLLNMVSNCIAQGTCYCTLAIASLTMIGPLIRANVYLPPSLYLLACDDGPVAYLNAIRFGIERIYFGGFFIRQNEFAMDRVSFSIDYFSKGKSKALFLRHEGYLGALGAFLCDTESASNPWFQQFKNDLISIGEQIFTLNGGP